MFACLRAYCCGIFGALQFCCDPSQATAIHVFHTAVAPQQSGASDIHKRPPPYSEEYSYGQPVFIAWRDTSLDMTVPGNVLLGALQQTLASVYVRYQLHETDEDTDNWWKTAIPFALAEESLSVAELMDAGVTVPELVSCNVSEEDILAATRMVHSRAAIV